MEKKVWFITGASSGFGYEFAKAALERGDFVAATVRKPEALTELENKYPTELIPLRLDVTNRKAVFEAVKAAKDHFGRLDIVVSNAGYGHFGPVEEISEDSQRAQMETNFFGSFHVIQAVLPILREQKSGHILQVTSNGGVAAFPFVGAYNASKWALEGFVEALSYEVAPIGIKITLVEPGGFATGFASAVSVTESKLEPYATMLKGFLDYAANAKYDDPAEAAQRILQVVDAENPPLRILLGSGTTAQLTEIYNQRLKTWAEWDWDKR